MKGVMDLDFLNRIKERARGAKKTIALPESMDIRVVEAAHTILEEGLANVILIGSKEEITKVSKGSNLDGAMFVDPNQYDKMDSLIDSFVEIRKSKGMTRDEGEKLLKENPLYLGVMLVHGGIADGMVAGAEFSTADVLRPSLQVLKTAPNIKLVSSLFVMVVPACEYGEDGVFVFSDCGLVQNPNAEELASIAVSSANSFKNLVEVDPIVAMLSHSSKGSAKHPDVDKVVEATKIAKEMAPNITLDGEFQLDAAIVPSVGKSKAPGSDVAGKANVLIFPDIDAGNIGYKLVQRLAKAEAYGPITQGIGKPVNDLSRGCTSSDIVGVVAITAVQAQMQI